MAQEDQSQKCSNSTSTSGGGGASTGNTVRSSKKQKPKKVPQRGLGVAQLEKIRLEEQQKQDAAAVLPSPSTILSPTNSSYLSLPIPSYHNPLNHSSSSSSSIPFSADHSSTSSIFRPPPLVQSVDVVGTNTVPLPNPIGCSPASVPGNAHNVTKLWNSCDYNRETESFGLDLGLGFEFKMILPYESNPIWPLPGLMQRAHHYQQPSSSMVNVSSATSSSSVLYFPVEPPSNQSYNGNHTSMCPEEDKMVGLKRPYPFSLDDPPGLSFLCKVPSIAHHPNSRLDEANPRSIRGGTYSYEPGNPNFSLTHFREGHSQAISMPEPNSRRSKKDNRVLDGDFLSLAPPTTSASTSTSFRPTSSLNPGYYNHQYPNFEPQPHHLKTRTDGSSIEPGHSGSNQHQAYHSFFPAPKEQIDQATSSETNCSVGEVRENVDLNLKL